MMALVNFLSSEEPNTAIEPITINFDSSQKFEGKEIQIPVASPGQVTVALESKEIKMGCGINVKEFPGRNPLKTLGYAFLETLSMASIVAIIVICVISLISGGPISWGLIGLFLVINVIADIASSWIKDHIDESDKKFIIQELKSLGETLVQEDQNRMRFKARVISALKKDAVELDNQKLLSISITNIEKSGNRNGYRNSTLTMTAYLQKR